MTSTRSWWLLRDVLPLAELAMAVPGRHRTAQQGRPVRAAADRAAHRRRSGFRPYPAQEADAAMPAGSGGEDPTERPGSAQAKTADDACLPGSHYGASPASHHAHHRGAGTGRAARRSLWTLRRRALLFASLESGWPVGEPLA
jgi:hypothetical protein